MSDVFISYARADGEVERELAHRIAEAGLSVNDGLSLEAGTDWWATIKEQLERASCLVLIWSRSAASSQWVQEEVRRAIRAWSGDRLVLAVLDGAELPTALRDLPRADAVADPEHWMEGVVERAREVVNRGDLRALSRSASSERLDESTGAYRLSPSSARSGARIAVGALTAGMLALLVGVVLTAGKHLGWSVVGQLLLRILVLILLVVIVAIAAVAGVWSIRRWLGARRGRVARATSPPATPAVFISYSRRDSDWVDRVVRWIEERGFPTWLDRTAGQGGAERYAGRTVKAIRSSRVVALFGSQHAYASSQVVREVYVAGDFKKPFIVIQLDDCEIPDEFLYFLSGYPRLPVAELTPERLHVELLMPRPP